MKNCANLLSLILTQREQPPETIREVMESISKKQVMLDNLIKVLKNDVDYQINESSESIESLKRIERELAMMINRIMKHPQ